MSGTRVLVTGGGGFLGRYVVEAHLKRGDAVVSLARNRYPILDQLGVEQVQGDLRDPAALDLACRGVELVQHSAALAGIWGPWRRYYEINTLGTRQLLDACRKRGVGRLVFTSSPSVTFDGRDQSGVDESVGYARRFLCHYPHSKALAEQAVLAANSHDLKTCALRPHLIWGPRDQHLIPRLLQRARSGQLRRVGDGSNRVDTIFVENAAEAQVQAADALAVTGTNPVAGKAYFLSQGEPVNCWDWIDEILQLAGLAKLNRSIGYPTAWFAGSLLELAHWMLRRDDEPRMSRFLAAQLAKPHFFDISAAKRDFGYVARVSHQEGMRRLAEWLQTQPAAEIDSPVDAVVGPHGEANAS